MKVGTLVGLILIVLGVVGLVYGGISWTKRRDTVGIGPIEVTTTQKETVPISPIIGGVLLIAGVALVVATKRAR
jgi:hypothetical protein